MTPAEKITARTLELAGDTDPRQQSLIRALSTVTARNLQELLPADAEEVLVDAGSLLTLADFLESGGAETAERFTVGDVTVENRDLAQTADCLRRQARQMTEHLRADAFRFRGV